jgi:ribosomal protein S18 acetylase RimI-like enzyme
MAAGVQSLRCPPLAPAPACHPRLPDHRYHLVAGPERTAEIAVADDYQDVALGQALVRLMLSVAAAHGIETIVAEVC